MAQNNPNGPPPTPHPKGSRTKMKGVRMGKQVSTIMGGVNKAALERIVKLYKPKKNGRTMLTPLEIFVDFMNDVNQSNRLRMDAAKEAAQYFHFKMPAPEPAPAETKSNDSQITINVMTPETQVFTDIETESSSEDEPVEEQTSIH